MAFTKGKKGVNPFAKKGAAKGKGKPKWTPGQKSAVKKSGKGQLPAFMMKKGHGFTSGQVASAKNSGAGQLPPWMQ